MTPTAQRIAIAEVCGWRIEDLPNHHNGPKTLWRTPEGKILQIGTVSALPDYLSDLNAMHEAWATLPWDKQCEFSRKLHEVCGSNQLNHVVNATASQRAEALLRTLNLWKD